MLLLLVLLFCQRVSSHSYETSRELLPDPNSTLQRTGFGPGSRFSKAPETFRARKVIFSSSVSKDEEVYTPETFCMKRTSFHIKNL